MNIFKRISDIITANMQEMVDTAENPEPILKQAVAEMEQEIAKATKTVANVMAREKLLRHRLDQEQSQIQQWQQRAETAVTGGDDQAGRTALGRKHEHAKVAAALTDQLTEVESASQTLRHQLDAMKAKIAEARRSLATLTARHRAAKMSQQSAGQPLKADAFDKFDRMSEKVTMAEAEAEAMRDLAGPEASNAADRCDVSWDTDTSDDEVEAELAALKQQRT